MRVMGVDTSLRSSGVALIEARGSVLKAVEYQLVKNPADRALSACLQNLYHSVVEIIGQWKPDEAAIEGIFFCRNVKTAVVLGHARGVVIAACASAGVPVYEYSPRRIKQAVVGFGSAGKEQVRKMITAILALDEEPRQDASDAFAIAICHLHSKAGHPELMPKEI